MRLLHASAMIMSWQLRQRFDFSCLTKVHIQKKWSLPDSNANYTNVTKRLQLIVLPGRCNTSSVICLILSSKTALLPCTYGEKEKKYTHRFFFFFQTQSMFQHVLCVCSGWEREWVLQSLRSLQTDNRIGHININMQCYCQNISFHGLWFRIGWLSQTEPGKVVCIQACSVQFPSWTLGVDEKYFNGVFPRSSPRVARFYHYKFGLNGTYSVSCTSFLKVTLGGSLEHLHLH